MTAQFLLESLAELGLYGLLALLALAFAASRSSN